MAAAMSYLYTDINLMSRKIILSVKFAPRPSRAERNDQFGAEPSGIVGGTSAEPVVRVSAIGKAVWRVPTSFKWCDSQPNVGDRKAVPSLVVARPLQWQSGLNVGALRGGQRSAPAGIYLSPTM
jgi:hypothetical protein